MHACYVYTEIISERQCYNKSIRLILRHGSAISSLRDLKYLFIKKCIWPPYSNFEKHAISKQSSKQTTKQLWLKSQQQQLIGNHQLKFALYLPDGSFNHLGPNAQGKPQVFMIFPQTNRVRANYILKRLFQGLGAVTEKAHFLGAFR